MVLPKAKHGTQDPKPPDAGLDVAQLFRQHGNFVWRCLRRLGVPDAGLEDAVQDVFLVVHRQRGRYEERGSMRTWLFVIARRVAWTQHRHTQRQQKISANLPREPAAGTAAEALERKEGARLIGEFLHSLNEDQRLVFTLSDMEGFSAPEIAEALDMKLNTVYSRLRAARQKLERVIHRQRTRQRRERG